MRRRVIIPVVLAALALAAAAVPASAQAAFKVAFPFDAAGKKLAAGMYSIGAVKDGQITLRQEATGKEYAIPFTQKLTPPVPAPAGPQLVFDEVGDFAPSYTEYVTVYLLAEVWSSPADGFLIHTTKGSHKNTIVPAVEIKK
ncbi:MAG: hypothetical protein PHI34_06815 [Acidobacteriota bacterium]|nr:hypothetical protein [Acidobacteriota bacterium]